MLQPLSRKEPGLLPAPGKGKWSWDKIKSRMAPAAGPCRGLAPHHQPRSLQTALESRAAFPWIQHPPPTIHGEISLQESPLNYGGALGCPQPSPSPHTSSHLAALGQAEPILSKATHRYFAFLFLFCCCCCSGKFFAAGLLFFHSLPFSKVS